MRLLGYAGFTGFAGGSLVTACGGVTPVPTESETAPVSSLDDRADASIFPDGSIVRTILEDVPPDRFTHGAVLFHEHMSMSVQSFWDRLLGDAPSEAREERIGSPDAPFFLEDVDTMVAELQAASREGVSALVDGGHDDMGRSVAFLREISEKSGMPIVASGGYYIDQFHPPELESQTEDDIAAALADAATAERWGAFGEIASSAEITPSERKVLAQLARHTSPHSWRSSLTRPTAWRQSSKSTSWSRSGCRSSGWRLATSGVLTTPTSRSTRPSRPAARLWGSTALAIWPGASEEVLNGVARRPMRGRFRWCSHSSRPAS